MRRIALLFATIALCSLLFAETLRYQGFEEDGLDNWSYTADSNPSRLIYWGRVNTNLGDATPYNGQWYWASWDLDNIPSSLTFDNVSLAWGYRYSLSFYYFTEGLNAETEYSRYCTSIDNGLSWSEWQNLLPNSNAWTLASISLPAYATQLKLKVEAMHDGMSKFAHWDHFRLERDIPEPCPPLVYNLSATQRMDGSGLVDIHYCLYDANLEACNVSLLLANGIDADYNHSPNPANLSGDFGTSIVSGENKLIIWNAAAEGIDFEGNYFRLKVIAEDGTVYDTVASPSFSPGSDTYSSPQYVMITCATEGAIIRYSTDGSNPDENSQVYTNPILISSSTTLKARAYKDPWTPSDIAVVEYIVDTTPENFVLVPGGTFTMGDTIGTKNTDEKPTHSVTLNPFYMGKYEVTQAEWTAIFGYNPAWGYGVGDNYPIYNISWYSMLKYCNLRSMAEELTPAYTINNSVNPANWGVVPSYSDASWNAVLCNWNANGYRLPTEAEWEYAARAATNNPDYLYSGSDSIATVAWFEENNSPNGSKPVGSKSPNGLGLYDMSGNLYEWCWDWYGSTYYDSSPSDNPTGPASNYSRVERGGRWHSVATGCRVTNRGNDYPYFSGNYLGFRLCRIVE